MSCQQEMVERQIIQSLIWVGSFEQHPLNPESGWAYYNTCEGVSYVYTDTGWQVIAHDGIGIQWKGELYSAPSNPQRNWAYFNVVDGNSYIYNGSSWDYLAKSGSDGSSGILKWLGDLPSAPEHPTDGDAYHDIRDGASYIYSNGEWSVIARDGIDSTFNWLGEMENQPDNPSSGDAYYNTSDNTSYIYNGLDWDILVKNTSNYYSVPFNWRGELSQAPSSPQVGWLYYNTTVGASYIWDGATWQQLAKDGYSPTGFLIQWKGTSDSHPENPEQGWAYYNPAQGAAFLFDGEQWVIFAQTQLGVADYSFRIFYNGQEIKPGDTIDIGTISEGSWEPLIAEFTIENNGRGVLVFPNDVILSDSSSDKAMSMDCSEVPLYLNPGESCSFKAIYNPSAGTYSQVYHTFTIYSNAYISPFSFIATAESNNPVMTANCLIDDKWQYCYFWSGVQTTNNGSFYFGQVNNGDEFSLSISFMKKPSEPYNISIEGEDAECFDLEVSNNSFTLRMHASEIGVKSAELVVGNESFHYSVPLYANFIDLSLVPEFEYAKFNSSNLVYYDGGEGDGDDYCYFAMDDESDGYYFFGTAYERVSYSSGDDFWIIHAANDGSIISEHLFDQVPSDMYFLGGKLLQDGSIVLASDDYVYMIPKTTDTYSSYRIDADDVCFFTDDSFYVIYGTRIQEYSFTGEVLETINLSSHFSSISDIVMNGDLLFVGGYKSDAVAADSAKDAIILKVDMTSGDVLNAIQIDESHGDDDDVTSLLVLDNVLYVTGTSYDLISSRSEVDGWLRAYDISDMTELENHYYESDTSPGTLFYHNGILMDWSVWRIGRYDFGEQVGYSSVSLSWTYPLVAKNSVPMISGDEFLISGCAYEGANEVKNGNDWAIKRFNLDELF